MNWKVGDQRTIVRTITQEDIAAFARVSGDDQPLHLDEEFARKSRFGGIVAHGMLSGAIFSALLGKHIPGEGTILKSMGPLKFWAPIRPGERITYVAQIWDINEKGHMELELYALNTDGAVVCSGTAQVVYRPAKAAA